MARAEAKYKLTAEDQTARGLRSAESRLQRFQAKAASIFTGLQQKMVVPLAAVGAAILAWSRPIARVADELDNLAKRAEDIGSTAEQYEEIRRAAALLGVEERRLVRFFEAIDRTATQAAEGPFSRIGEMFREMQIDPERLLALTRPQQLAEVALGVQSLDPSRRGAVRQAVAGERTGRLLTEDTVGALASGRLLGGIEGLEERTQAAERMNDEITMFGEVLRNGTRALADTFDVASDFTRLARIGIMGVSDGGAVGPAMAQAALEQIRDDIRAMREDGGGLN